MAQPPPVNTPAKTKHAGFGPLSDFHAPTISRTPFSPKHNIEGVSDEMNTIESQNSDHAPAQRRVQQLDH
ncbi:unnamed protein product, partial [Ilex paraguariensis]